MSNSCWIAPLLDNLNNSPARPHPLSTDSTRRIALLGIGNELNGDDAAGVLIVRLLAQLIQNPTEHTDREGDLGDLCASLVYQPLRTSYFQLKHYELMVVEGGIGPEAFSGPLRRFEPDWVILIDAAAMDEPAGTTAWVDWRMADGLSATTHTMPPTMLAKFLIHELGCQVGLIGIQPASVEMDAPLHADVLHAVCEVASDLAGLLLE